MYRQNEHKFLLKRVFLVFHRFIYPFDTALYNIIYIEKRNTNMMMEQELTAGVKILNGFLRIMVACLVVILIAIPLALLLDIIGVL
jgi:hypothetical protein